MFPRTQPIPRLTIERKDERPITVREPAVGDKKTN